MITPFALAVFVSALQAAPIPKGAVAAALDINRCWQANPFASGTLDKDDLRGAFWNNACVDQTDACALLHDAERAKVKAGYCLACSGKAAPGGCAKGTSCTPEQVCKAPAAGVLAKLPLPEEGEGDFRQPPLKPASAAKPKVCRTTPGCITRYVSRAYADKIALKSQMSQAWSASRFDRDVEDYTKCDELTLRNAEHYLYHYWSRLDSQAYNQFPLAFCGISYGYSAVKWAGIKNFIMNDPGKDSEPSMEEAYWGCRGLWDAYEPEQKVAFGSCD